MKVGGDGKVKYEVIIKFETDVRPDWEDEDLEEGIGDAIADTGFSLDYELIHYKKIS